MEGPEMEISFSTIFLKNWKKFLWKLPEFLHLELALAALIKVKLKLDQPRWLSGLRRHSNAHETPVRIDLNGFNEISQLIRNNSSSYIPMHAGRRLVECYEVG